MIVSAFGVLMIPVESSGQTPSAREQLQRRLYQQRQQEQWRQQQQLQLRLQQQQELEHRRQQQLQQRQLQQQVRGQQMPPPPRPALPSEGSSAYLIEMPTVADVLQRTPGSDPVDTAARQVAAFNQLFWIMRVLRPGGEFGNSPTSPQENALGQTYNAAKQEAESRGQSLVAKTVTATSGPESAGPK